MTCVAHVTYALCMTTLQIRNVPDEISRTLKTRAAKKGQSLSEYLLAEVTRIAERPTIEELTERIRLREPVETGTTAAEIIRAERDAR
jgi:plasmid stability protein